MFKKDNSALIATIAVCSLLVSGSLIFLGTQLAKGGANSQELTSWAEDLAPFVDKVNLEEQANDPIIGDADAEVKIVEYSDYQCPFCRRFFLEAYQQIKTEFIDTGVASLTFKDFPLDFHQDALYAHNAAECAKQEGGNEVYFAFHDALFNAQGPVTNGTVAITEKMIKDISDDLNITSRQFDKCVEDGQFFDQVARDLVESSQTEAKRIAEINPNTGQPQIREALPEEQIGVNATPTLFVNDIKIVGAQPFEVFKMAIESELNNN